MIKKTINYIVRLIIYYLLKVITGLLFILTFSPFFRGVWKQLYSATLFGRADGHYYRKEYPEAFRAYKKAIAYYEENDLERDYDLGGHAYEHLGHIYEEGLGVDKDELKAEEYFLRAGTRGERVYEHSLATRSIYKKYLK